VKISHGKTDRQIGRRESNKINANIPLYFKTCCQRKRGPGIKNLFDIVKTQKKKPELDAVLFVSVSVGDATSTVFGNKRIHYIKAGNP
jgi:hypothetical protein